MQQHLGSLIAQYASQGTHRTGTEVDAASASWLQAQLRGVADAAGVVVEVVADCFPMQRRSIVAGSLIVESQEGAWYAPGVPLYDCAEYTDLEGVTGTLGRSGEDCDIALVEYVNANLPDATAGFMEARQSDRHRAVLAVYAPPRGQVGGLALMNAQHFTASGGGIGRPTLQLHSRHLEALRAAADSGARARLVASAEAVEAYAVNISAEVVGSDASLAPVVVMTPRSGWWSCAVERGAGLASFVEIFRAVAAARPKRSVLFVANTGHELGHLGNVHCWEQRPGYVEKARLCVHLGANLGGTSSVLLQVSDAEAEATARQQLALHGLDLSKLTLRTGAQERPVGEARELYDHGARYVSLICSGFQEFHMEEDREVAVDMPLLMHLTQAAIGVVLTAAMEEADLQASSQKRARY
mmetsp:Transcript_120917/g.269880  ORF Transcript_120917/g.269880 Transcript_120917/m.269880 type:complete len:413 (+) Transcript_120917:145-1383(+)